MKTPKKQSGDPLWDTIWGTKTWVDNNGNIRTITISKQDVMGDFPAFVSKTDISFQDTAQDIVDTVEKEIKPLMKRMTGRHYSKILEDLEKVRKLADKIRREAESQRI